MQPTILLTPSFRRVLDSRVGAAPQSRVIAGRIAGGVIVVAAVVAAACTGEARGAGAPAEPPVAVRVADVVPAGSTPITVSGTLGAKDAVPLAFKIGGVVARVAVDEGAHVHAGQVLAELDLREIDAAVAKAAAAATRPRVTPGVWNASIATRSRRWLSCRTRRPHATSPTRTAAARR